MSRLGGASGHYPCTQRSGDVLVAVPKPFPMATRTSLPRIPSKGGSVKMRPRLGFVKLHTSNLRKDPGDWSPHPVSIP
jgi:hypothetical protein